MSLLALQAVSKRYSEGAREHVVLHDASLALAAGELAVVWGLRRSGRSTLLRLAAGVEAPDSGVVRFDGRDLAGAGGAALGGGIGYVQQTPRAAEGPLVLDQVMAALLGRGVTPAAARTHALSALERTGARDCAAHPLRGLDGGEAMRVALARVLALEPRLIVIDEPTKAVELSERDGILLLLRSLADQGIAVLASTGDSTALSGSDLALSLSEGELRSGRRELAPVLSLRRGPRRAAG